MADKFVTVHAGAKKAETRANDIFAIKQSPGEGLRDFLARFNYVRMTLPNVSEGMAVAAFQNGLSRNEIVYAMEKLGPKVKWPQKIRSDPNTRKSNALCEFHQERGHKIEDCIALRKEVINMLHQGHLKELMSNRGRANFARGREQHQGPPKPPSPTRTIQMIIGGGDGASINNVKFTTTHRLKHSITHEWYDELEESIIFDMLDTHNLVFPHYDALVITLRILDTYVRYITVDDGIGACIIHPQVLVQMKLEDKIVSRYIMLTGFNNALKRTSGEITLPFLAGGVTLETIFHIMDQDMAYNSIIGRPWIYSMKAIPSSLYQIIKFPTLWGVFSIRGEQRTYREYHCIAQDCTYTQQIKGKVKEA
ncbi:uncharacterized protein LOC107810675 [Nicotiana tabacum]|uniref:Uncharacterized protein LOC107810675 n=1 Tax=Nicotiana tabacum TaxID=4097 RepID=A0A1S4BPZ7_TOBAC